MNRTLTPQGYCDMGRDVLAALMAMADVLDARHLADVRRELD